MGKDRARPAAVAHVAGEASVLLVVGAGGPDADPFRAGRVLLVRVLLPFLQGVRAEGGGDGTPGDALGFETGGRIVLLDARGLGLGILLGLRDGRRLFIRPFR